MRARYANDIEIAHAQRDFELKKASYDQEVETKKAQSELAYDLQVRGAERRFLLEARNLSVLGVTR